MYNKLNQTIQKPNTPRLQIGVEYANAEPQSIWLNISISLLWLYSLAMTWPHLPPWSTAGATLTVLVWRATPWLLPLLLVLFFVAAYASHTSHTTHQTRSLPSCHSPIRDSVWYISITVVVAIVSCLYVLLLYALKPTIPTWPGPLFTCSLYCPSVVDSCQPIGTVQRNASIPTLEAFNWFERHVFGVVNTSIVATVSSDNRSLTLTAKDTLTSTLLLPSDLGDNSNVVIGRSSSLSTVQQLQVSLDVPDAFQWPSNYGIYSMGPDIAVGATAMVAIQTALQERFDGVRINFYGCSIGGKRAGWAASLAARAGTPVQALYMESPGTLIASTQYVGVCGETLRAMRSLRSDWVSSSVDAIPNLARTPHDVAHALALMCPQTAVVISYSETDWWNNPEGTKRTINILRRAGCAVEVVSDRVRHCGHLS